MMNCIDIAPINDKNPAISIEIAGFWQGKKVSNPRPTVLETVALPTELFPYAVSRRYNNINHSAPIVKM